MLTFKLVESSNRFALHVHVDYKANESHNDCYVFYGHSTATELLGKAQWFAYLLQNPAAGVRITATEFFSEFLFEVAMQIDRTLPIQWAVNSSIKLNEPILYWLVTSLN